MFPACWNCSSPGFQTCPGAFRDIVAGRLRDRAVMIVDMTGDGNGIDRDRRKRLGFGCRGALVFDLASGGAGCRPGGTRLGRPDVKRWAEVGCWAALDDLHSVRTRWGEGSRRRHKAGRYAGDPAARGRQGRPLMARSVRGSPETFTLRLDGRAGRFWTGAGHGGHGEEDFAPLRPGGRGRARGDPAPSPTLSARGVPFEDLLNRVQVVAVAAEGRPLAEGKEGSKG